MMFFGKKKKKSKPYIIKDGEISNVDVNTSKEFSVPDRVEIIGHTAFHNCKKLKKVCLPMSVKEIHGYAFKDCVNLSEIRFSQNLEVIEPYAFENCEKLENIILPDTVTRIGDFAFKNCWTLKSIEFSDNIVSINQETFSGCRSLKSIELPANTAAIMRAAFKGCFNLEYITFNAQLININSYAFEGCDRLRIIELPESVSYIGKGAFKNCGTLIFICNNFDITIDDNAFVNSLPTFKVKDIDETFKKSNLYIYCEKNGYRIERQITSESGMKMNIIQNYNPKQKGNAFNDMN